MTTENPLWLNNRVQFARLLCELVATQDGLNLASTAESMDLKLAEVQSLFDRAHEEWEASKARVAEGVPVPPDDAEYSYAHLEAGACMWEHVIAQLNRRTKPDPKVNRPNAWDDYREAYGAAALRETVIRHAPVLVEAYNEAYRNGYDKPFDWEFVPKYMEDHVARILT